MPNFLDLPDYIQDTIFRHTELVTKNFLHLHDWTARGDPPHHHTKSICYMSIPTSLLCLNRAITSRALRTFWSENRFLVCRDAHGSLSVLWQPEVWWENLRYLKIEFHSASANCETEDRIRRSWVGDEQDICTCVDTRFRPGADSRYKCRCRGKFSWQSPSLSIAKHSGQVLLRHLEQLVQGINKRRKLGELTLVIVCDCEDVETVEAYSSVLRSLSGLKAFGVQFAVYHRRRGRGRQTDNRSFLDQERQLVRHIKGTDGAIDLTSIQRLPPELFSRILAFTGLVLPDPSWSVYGDPRSRKECKACLSMELRDQPTTFRPWLFYPSHFLSGTISTCTCPRFPRALLQVSRQVRAESLRIHYSQSLFALRLEAELPQFCEKLASQGHLPRLRSLLIYFEHCLCSSDWKTTSSAIWTSALKLLAQQCTWSQLSLTLHFSSCHRCTRPPESVARSSSTRTRLETIQSALDPLLHHIKTQGSLRTFSLHPRWDIPPLFASHLEHLVTDPDYRQKNLMLDWFVENPTWLAEYAQAYGLKWDAERVFVPGSSMMSGIYPMMGYP